MAAHSTGKVTISLSGIEADSATPGGWRFWSVLALQLGFVVLLLAAGPGQLGRVVQVLHRPQDAFFAWLGVVFGTLLMAAVTIDRMLALRHSRVEVDREAGTVRVLHNGLWSRRSESARLVGARDLALIETRDDDAAAWRLEFRWTRKGGRGPLTIMQTHHRDRLERLARRLTEATGLLLVIERLPGRRV